VRAVGIQYSLASTPRGTASHEPEGTADRVTFDELYERHFDFVWRSVRRLGVPDAGLDDAVQEVFVTAYRRLDSFRGRPLARAWLFGIAVRVAHRSHRTARRHRAGNLPDEFPAPAGDSPHDATARSEAVAVLYELLDCLDADKRAVFVLAELEEMTAPEIAAALEIPINTVYSRLRAARRNFNSALARHRARDRWRHR
jgi:RNA polymerase sigma-70 factor (ECF subfamily)